MEGREAEVVADIDVRDAGDEEFDGFVIFVLSEMVQQRPPAVPFVIGITAFVEVALDVLELKCARGDEEIPKAGPGGSEEALEGHGTLPHGFSPVAAFVDELGEG